MVGLGAKISDIELQTSLVLSKSRLKVSTKCGQQNENFSRLMRTNFVANLFLTCREASLIDYPLHTDFLGLSGSRNTFLDSLETSKPRIQRISNHSVFLLVEEQHKIAKGT